MREALQQQAAQGEAVSAEHANQQQRVQLQRNMALSEELVSCKVQLAQAEAAMQQVSLGEMWTASGGRHLLAEKVPSA